MYLHEEYFLRKNLDVPVVVTAKKAAVLLKNQDSWLGHTLVEGDGGMITFKKYSPRHDSRDISSLNSTFDIVTTVLPVEDYEDYLTKSTKFDRNLGYIPVDEHELETQLWNMFLYVRDSWLALNMPREFFGLVMHSLHPACGEKIDAALALMPTDMKMNFKSNAFYGFMRSHYADWWARLYA